MRCSWHSRLLSCAGTSATTCARARISWRAGCTGAVPLTTTTTTIMLQHLPRTHMARAVSPANSSVLSSRALSSRLFQPAVTLHVLIICAILHSLTAALSNSPAARRAALLLKAQAPPARAMLAAPSSTRAALSTLPAAMRGALLKAQVLHVRAMLAARSSTLAALSTPPAVTKAVLQTQALTLHTKMAVASEHITTLAAMATEHAMTMTTPAW